LRESDGTSGKLRTMEITVIGSGTGVPSLRRGSPGIVIRVGTSTLLLDSGSGTLQRMLQTNIDYKEVDYLLYSHFHPDHTSDLVPFLFASNYGSEEKRTDGIKMIGPAGMQQFYEGLKAVYGRWIVPQDYTLTIMEITEEVITFPDFSLQGFYLLHSDSSVGFRVTSREGKTVAYSGDTDLCANLVTLAREVDLLVLECSFPDSRKVEGHLTPSLAGRVAREAGCKKLLLTHLYPPCDDESIVPIVKEQYAGEVIVAEDLMKIRVTS
jgi:ribonuclease BN (tRNA processing enzyme)